MTADPEDGTSNNDDSEPRPPDSPVTLRSLAPAYVEAEHSGYVRHLERALTDPKIKNIALTGRYGSGKSSVLDKFESKHKEKTLRISINTLGPDPNADEDLTNRIQKELVKQLIYRAKPGTLRRSRFARSAPLTKRRALFEALGAAVAGLVLLWLLDVRPSITGFDSSHHPLTRALVGALFVSLVVAVVWVGRLLIGDRIVSQVATAGTTVTLGEKTETYFDEFLDEIVAFFDAVRPEFVIFEDLDRFDNSQIFDSLRELNTLINASAHWKDADPPLRFIYAIKDSLFERLGVDPEDRDETQQSDAGDGGTAADTAKARKVDPAAAAVERANRTKFFELVIPVVPFISHRNARDHIVAALKHLGLPKDVVTRPLLDLVARHATDMRLLLNICNEFVVFAERLLWVEKKNRAPGLTADKLFALVVYKNFHLADFEAIPQRGSALDDLEEHHRDLVRASIGQLQKQKRELIRTEDLARDQDQTAETLGQRLVALSQVVATSSGRPYTKFDVAGHSFEPAAVAESTFWRRVVGAGALSFVSPQPQSSRSIPLDNSQLTAVFPEVMDAERWREPSDAELTRQTQQYDRDIAKLRGADFTALTRDDRYKTEDEKTFNDLVKADLNSDLARDLVRRGFINRNYAEYSALFYGSFVGVDVAFFYNHSVQPNQMYLDYKFTTPNAVKILLEQAPGDFTSSVSALNIQVVEYLLTDNSEAATEVVEFLVADHGTDARTFLETFLNLPDLSHDRLIALLAAHPWPDVFDYITNDDAIPGEAIRVKLLDTALLHARSPEEYTFEGMETHGLLSTRYPELSAFRKEQSPEQTEVILAFARSAGVIVADLEHLAGPLRTRVISERMYDLTAHNLRVALNINGAPTLDAVRENDPVWQYCREYIDQYLTAIRDDQSEHAVQTDPILSEVITEQHEEWSADQLRQVVGTSAPSASLPDLTTVPTETWPTVIDADRVVPTVANVWAYIEANGVDEQLARFLMNDDDAPIDLQAVEDADVGMRTKAAVSILNASSLLPPTTRVRLAVDLDLPDGVEATDLVPADDALLARALQAKLVPDTLATFEHFVQNGWSSVSEAFAVSANIEDFMSPELVSGIVADVLADRQTPDGIRSKIVEDLADYVADGDHDALTSAGQYAKARRIKLPFVEVRRIARATNDRDSILYQLVRASELSADEIVDVLVLLGPPYDSLADGQGSEFAYPAGGSSTDTLFDRMKAAGRIEYVKNKARRGKKIRNLA